MKDAIELYEIGLLLEIMRQESKHFTVFAFNSGYKVAFGTPDMDTGSRPGLVRGVGSEQVKELVNYKSLKDALLHALMLETNFHDLCNFPEDFGPDGVFEDMVTEELWEKEITKG